MATTAKKTPSNGVPAPASPVSGNRIVTLDEFIIRSEKDFDFATGELTGLLRDIGVAAKIINREVNKAGLVNIIGVADSGENQSGDMQQKLDVYANEKLIECLKNSGECCAIASEENDDIIHIPPIGSKKNHYIVMFDPLDGSSNIDVNVSVGTIFAIYRRKSDPANPATKEDFLQAGVKQVAAGYVLYGTSTILVYTTGRGVNGFTLDPSIGEFCLSHRNMRIHRILIQGGIFLYPSTRKYPKGKLRLLYECNPLSMIVEQAGGKAMNTQLKRILDVMPNELHQRCTIAIGSPAMVDELKAFIERYSALPL